MNRIKQLWARYHVWIYGLAPIVLLVILWVVMLPAVVSMSPVRSTVACGLVIALAWIQGLASSAVLVALSRFSRGRSGMPMIPPDTPGEVRCGNCGWRQEVIGSQAHAAILHHAEYECPHREDA